MILNIKTELFTFVAPEPIKRSELLEIDILYKSIRRCVHHKKRLNSSKMIYNWRCQELQHKGKSVWIKRSLEFMSYGFLSDGVTLGLIITNHC
jgi:hypothetical protein